MIGVRPMRLVAALLPCSLLLHEVVFAASGGGLRASHDYLELAVPIAAAIAASAACAALIAPLLGRSPAGDDRAPLAPLTLAAALVGIFVVQESTETLLLGGGPAAFAADLAAAWLLLPVALALGALAAVLIRCLERGSALIVRLIGGRRRARRRPASGPRLREQPLGSPVSPLAFGLARRGPPRLTCPVV